MASKSLIQAARSTALPMPDMSVSVYKLCVSRVNHHDLTPMELPCRVALGMVAACTPFHACTVLVCVSDKCLSLWHDLWGNNQGISLVPNGLRFLLIVSVYLTAEVSHQTVLPRPAAVSSISAVSLSRGCFPGPPRVLASTPLAGQTAHQDGGDAARRRPPTLDVWPQGCQRQEECLRCVRFYRFVLSGTGAEQLCGGLARQPDL